MRYFCSFRVPNRRRVEYRSLRERFLSGGDDGFFQSPSIVNTTGHMDKNVIALTLLEWIKRFLSWIGIPRDMLDELDEILFLILIVAIAFILAAIVHSITVHVIKRILKHKEVPVLRSLVQYRVVRNLTALIPPLIISALLPFAFDHKSGWYVIGEKSTWIYFFVVLIFSLNAILNTVGDALRSKEELQNRPMKGGIQLFQVRFPFVISVVLV